MNEREREGAGGMPHGDEAIEDGEATRASSPGSNEYPVVGSNAEVVHDKESQARTPEDTDPSNEDIDGTPERGGTPPGTDTRGA